MDNKKDKPSEGELEILQVLWEREPVTVKDIHAEIASKKNVGYTTTLKQIQRMFDKGLVSRKKDGKSHLYTSNIKLHETQNTLFDKLLNTAFKGSAMNLAMHALGKSKATPEEIKQLRELLDKMEKGEHNG
ncbi:BlaI/MecI/CopY family transcriptional regulator [Fulvivirgaceae bacterium BMA12]|uniref:BlaI/MecI/CopY family transcriptional regulator n=1 Tax=Agaribacillus aureus TaxID=3051825 RepID=A0ABT8LD64_9BACT|nr:BlaI/MecI/CopY family transcriptional regulator [Fulvivirgaceae bacterium BMA12]